MKALIIIDMFVRDVRGRYDEKKLIRNQLKLIEAFKKARKKVILVGGPKSGKSKPTTNPVMLALWGNEVSKNPEENKVIPELLGSPHDSYLSKPEYSAFFKTKLEKYCKDNNITDLYFAGISSGCCVYFSAADAAMRGIQPHIISDATGAPDKETHKQNLKKYDLLGPVITTTKLLEELS